MMLMLSRALLRILFVSFCLSALSVTATAQQTLEAGRIDDNSRHLWFTVSIEPETAISAGAYVGGQILLDIRFESYDPFKRLRLTLPEINDAQVTTLVRPHTLQINMMGGKGYSHATRLAIVPERAGVLIIPPIRVSGISQTRRGVSFEFEQTHPQQQIIVHPPSAEFAGKTWVVSSQATLEQSWTPDINTIRRGDTVRRRIVLDVTGVSADKLAELTLDSNTGYRVLSSELSVQSEQTEAGFTTRLEQVWDIYIEVNEVFYINAIEFPYWNPELASTEVVSAPRQRVEPLPKDAAGLREQLREAAISGYQTRRFGLLILLALPLIALFVILVLIARHALPTPADFRFWHASRQAGSALNFYAAFQLWERQTFAAVINADQEQTALLGAPALEQIRRMRQAIFASYGGDFDARHTAWQLIWASRKISVRRFVASIASRITQLL